MARSFASASDTVLLYAYNISTVISSFEYTVYYAPIQIQIQTIQTQLKTKTDYPITFVCITYSE